MPVCGDVMEPDLGIAEDDRRMLEEGINIVFHSAATIKFDETLRLVHVVSLVSVELWHRFVVLLLWFV